MRTVRAALVLFLFAAPLALAQSGTTFTADLAGDNEVPAVETDASGTVVAELNGLVLTLSGSFTGLESDYNTSIGSHIHGGAAGENGPVLIPLDPTLDADLRGGTFEAANNQYTLRPSLADSLASGLLYVNIHSVDNPAGEIRAQLLATADVPSVTADLAGANEVPPVETTGSGAVIAQLDGLELTLSGTFTGLESDYNTDIGSHIHGGAAGENGPVLIPLDPTLDADLRGGTFEAANNTFTLTQSQADSLLAGLFYVNIHSVDNPSGEIRGQLYVQLADARTLGVDARVGVQGTVTRAKGAFSYIQDGTAALAIRQTSGEYFDAVADGTIGSGTVVAARGTLSEFANSLQINAGDLEGFTIGTTVDVPPAQDVTLADLAANGEAYEDELVAVADLLVTTTDETFQAATTYDIIDPSDDSNDVSLRIPNAEDSDVDGTEVPAGFFAFEGVVGQFEFDDPTVGYQLLAIEETDIEVLMAQLQAIHNAPDPAFTVVDVYVNGDPFLEDFAFRTGSPFVEVPAGVELTVAVAPGDSEGPEDAIFTEAYTLGSGLNYQLIASGVGAGDFEPNPDGEDIAFTLLVNPDAKTFSETDDTVSDFNFVHGTPDAPTIDVRTGETQDIILFNDVAYGGITGYQPVVPDFEIEVSTADGATTVAIFEVDLTDRIDEAGTILASGFLTPENEPADAPGFGLLVVFADGSEAFAAPIVMPNTEGDATVPTTFAVDGNYPNPFAGQTTLRYDLPVDAEVSIEVYDVLGRRVIDLAPETVGAGAGRTATLDAALPSGTYIYRVTAEMPTETRTETGRMTVVR